MDKKWSLFGISFGCVLVLLSQMMPTPYPLIVSGVVIAGASAKAFFKTKKKVR